MALERALADLQLGWLMSALGTSNTTPFSSTMVSENLQPRSSERPGTTAVKKSAGKGKKRAGRGPWGHSPRPPRQIANFVTPVTARTQVSSYASIMKILWIGGSP
jgi:hypothetical protein